MPGCLVRYMTKRQVDRPECVEPWEGQADELRQPTLWADRASSAA
jgi:hypothetical protein